MIKTFLGTTPLQAQYQIFFMKKLWVNVVPGKDVNADQIFYYHQELPKYLRGFHKCTKQDAIELAALILHASYDNDFNQAQVGVQYIKELIPADLIKAAGSSEWKKSILNEYKNSGEMTVEKAKLKFLKTIYKWPTFGSTFFEVKQTTEPTLPDIILIGINKQGVNILHSQTKVIIYNSTNQKCLCYFFFAGYFGYSRFLRAEQLVIRKHIFSPYNW